MEPCKLTEWPRSSRRRACNCSRRPPLKLPLPPSPTLRSEVNQRAVATDRLGWTAVAFLVGLLCVVKLWLQEGKPGKRALRCRGAAALWGSCCSPCQAVCFNRCPACAGLLALPLPHTPASCMPPNSAAMQSWHCWAAPMCCWPLLWQQHAPTRRHGSCTSATAS